MHLLHHEVDKNPNPTKTSNKSTKEPSHEGHNKIKKLTL